MKSVWSFLAALFISSSLIVGGMETAEAGKRFGGGQSFGSKFSQSQSVKRDSATTSAPAQKTSAAQTTNTDRKQQLAQKGGLMGMLGALAIGGLLGAMFFGGAFEGINFMDILLFGLIAFLLFKFLSSRAQRSAPTPATAGGYSAPDMEDDGNQQRQSQAEYTASNQYSNEPTLNTLRGGIAHKFDSEAFLEGAKSCFSRMQAAWDEGDLADIRQFTTDHVFGEIQDQMHAKTGQSQTEILDLHAELLKAEDLGSKQEAIVLFRASLKEDGNELTVEEVWHFVRPNNSTQPTWFLDGIQQVEG